MKCSFCKKDCEEVTYRPDCGDEDLLCNDCQNKSEEDRSFEDSGFI